MMSFKKYKELLKLNISILVIVTCYIGYYLGLRSLPGNKMMTDFESWYIFMILIFGTFLSSSGASIMNQYIERKYDSLMDRTKKRPLPNNDITPQRAFLIGSFLCVLGPMLLCFLINILTGFISFLTIFFYLFIYTPSKRLTSLNTIIGSVPGALPPVGGWAAATGVVDYQSIMLFGVLFCWQIPHFLSLAIIYKDDYKKAGFKMLPSVTENTNLISFQILFFTMALFYTSIGIYVINITSYVYVIGAILLGIIFLFYSSQILFDYSEKTIRKIFIFSIIYLPILLIMILLDSYFLN
tara:strand:- start:139 stop:1029 length:891 start_codon:yes stop_codon:yes gene_type:complete